MQLEIAKAYYTQSPLGFDGSYLQSESYGLLPSKKHEENTGAWPVNKKKKIPFQSFPQTYASQLY